MSNRVTESSLASSAKHSPLELALSPINPSITIAGVPAWLMSMAVALSLAYEESSGHDSHRFASRAFVAKLFTSSPSRSPKLISLVRSIIA